MSRSPCAEGMVRERACCGEMTQGRCWKQGPGRPVGVCDHVQMKTCWESWGLGRLVAPFPFVLPSPVHTAVTVSPADSLWVVPSMLLP